MALDKPYKNVPGTIIFDAEQARKGYHLNQFSMSFMKAENRARYLADREAYVDEWPLTDAQKKAVLALDLNAMMAEGGNIYFLSKIGATHGLSFQQMAGSMTGMSEAAYRDMMVAGGRRPEGVRLKDLDGWTPPEPGEKADTFRPDAPARCTSTLYTPHVPAIGAAMDLGKTHEPYWQKVFSGYEWTRAWAKENTPDVVILVYNDHATAFDSSLIPTFVLGTGAEYPVADEGYGPRPVPGITGYPELASHIAQSVIMDDFDLTLVNEMVVDHGLTVPLSLVFGEIGVDGEWPCRVIPLAVNVVQYPVPSGRCYELGKAIRRALDKWDGPELDVQVWSTGGMSHQWQGPRAGLINAEWDNAFLDHLIADPEGLTEWPHLEYVDEAGSEGIELVDWLIARGTMDDQFGGEPPEVNHRFYHVPASNTAVGHLVLSNQRSSRHHA